MAQIGDYYAGKSIFITGATGFLGKVLIEKLLRSCPKVENIFCLIRSKRRKNAKERLRELLEDKVIYVYSIVLNRHFIDIMAGTETM